MKNLKEQVIVRLPNELKQHLNEKAQKLGISTNALILQILWESTEIK